MKRILVIGAGRSSSYLIDYLIKAASQNKWEVCVADISAEASLSRTQGRPCSSAIAFDINNDIQRAEEIKKSDAVVSMLPAFMHSKVALDCINYKKHLVTASYVSPEIKALDSDAKKNGLIFLNEIGLDPGIDHMSAMDIINRVKEEGGIVTSFKSYCGGLVAPESNDNPWGYKFSWNPRNVVMAGQGTAVFLKNGKQKYIPYNRVFTDIEKIEIDNIGIFDGYANRDSLSYRALYELENVQTMIRGTLRYTGFCEAWNVFVKLGWTDDSFNIQLPDNYTYTDLLKSFLPQKESDVRIDCAAFLGVKPDSLIMQKLDWLGLFNNCLIQLREGSPAQLLQHLLEQKWKLKDGDKDMIVLQHEFECIRANKQKFKISSSLVVKGENQIHTAMAKTVGLPAAIGVKNILTGIIKTPGVIIPVKKEIYEPVLSELKTLGITFKEKNS